MRRRRKGGLCAEGSWSRSIFDMEAEDGRLRIVDGGFFFFFFVLLGRRNGAQCQFGEVALNGEGRRCVR